MTDLLAARSQMALTLGFHIVFACVGMAMPLLMIVAEAAWLWTGQVRYYQLARRWSYGVAVLFAVGAVSGTVLSFELGLLWPRFMEFAGPIIGIPFSIEGVAFFTEAIFLGIYLYGWGRISRVAHLLAGLMVALSGAASGAIVTTVNAWMNTPAGFTMKDGAVVSIDHVKAIFNPMAVPEGLHMVLAAYVATCFAVAGIHAALVRAFPREQIHRAGLWIAISVGAVMSFLQPVSGDILARTTARLLPEKLAAFEAHYQTEANAPERLIGPIQIPYGLSLLAFHDPHAVVKGLNDFPRQDWPAVQVVRPAFLLMVGSGMTMMALSGWAVLFAIRKRWFYDSSRLVRLWDRSFFARERILLFCLACASPLGFLAVEAGWTVTEVGRQPWIIHGVLRTAQAVTPAPDLGTAFAVSSIVYLVLGLMTFVLLRRIVFSVTEVEKNAGKGRQLHAAVA